MEIKIKDKLKYLKKHSPFATSKIKLTDKRFCIHCEKIITIGDYKVVREGKRELEFDYICCPNYPECNGSIIDWVSIPKK